LTKHKAEEWLTAASAPAFTAIHALLSYEYMMDTLALIQWINTQHDTLWALLGKFAGGYQGGAYALLDAATGQRAVLKCAFAPRAVPIVAQLRAVGYPTPAWLLHGTAPNDVPYVMQAFVPGAPMEMLTAAYLDQIFALNDLQANLHDELGSRGRTESSYAYDMVFANESGWAATMRTYCADTAHLLAALESAVHGYAEPRSFPTPTRCMAISRPTTSWWNTGASRA
jgi:hypothetical protein